MYVMHVTGEEKDPKPKLLKSIPEIVYCTHQCKHPLHVLGGEIAPAAVDVEEAELGGRVDHGLAHGRVVGIGDVDDGQVDGGTHGCCWWLYCCHFLGC